MSNIVFNYIFIKLYFHLRQNLYTHTKNRSVKKIHVRDDNEVDYTTAHN